MLQRSGCNDMWSIPLALKVNQSNRSTVTSHQEEQAEIVLLKEAWEYAGLVWPICLGTFSVS